MNQQTELDGGEQKDPRKALLPKALVVQLEGETLHEDVELSGWNVVEHTDDPISWLNVLENILSIDCVIVSPVALSEVPQISEDILHVIALVDTYMFIDVGHLLELTLVDEETDDGDTE